LLCDILLLAQETCSVSQLYFKFLRFWWWTALWTTKITQHGYVSPKVCYHHRLILRILSLTRYV